MFDFKPKRTRSGLIVSSETRRRTFLLALMAGSTAATPILIAMPREAYLLRREFSLASEFHVRRALDFAIDTCNMPSPMFTGIP